MKIWNEQKTNLIWCWILLMNMMSRLIFKKCIQLCPSVRSNFAFLCILRRFCDVFDILILSPYFRWKSIWQGNLKRGRVRLRPTLFGCQSLHGSWERKKKQMVIYSKFLNKQFLFPNPRNALIVCVPQFLPLQKDSIMEALNFKKAFLSGIAWITWTPHPLNLGKLALFFWTSKTAKNYKHFFKDNGKNLINHFC